MMHGPWSPWEDAEEATSCNRVAFWIGAGIGLLRDVPLQGLLRSDSSVPPSRASCSRVIGMKEPAYPSVSQMVVPSTEIHSTYAANDKHFGRPAIAVPTRQLLGACQPCILARVGGSIRWDFEFMVQLHAVVERG